ncbi:MAG: hypothetical protein ACOVK5_08665 [Ilumatobacteraceae bacterium]
MNTEWTGDVMEEIERITAELEQLSSDLNDAAMSILTEAIREGATSRPPEEKKVSQARRSVEKAIQHLRGF